MDIFRTRRRHSHTQMMCRRKERLKEGCNNDSTHNKRQKGTHMEKGKRKKGKTKVKLW